MKKILFLLIAEIILIPGCNKHDENIPPVQTAVSSLNSPKYLAALAGSDTTICMPYSGKGNIFKIILDGSASHDDSGKIVSYSWFNVVRNPLYTRLDNIEINSIIGSINYSIDSSQVILLVYGGGITQYMLKVRDDHGRVDSSVVTIHVNKKFDAEYDGLSWDSTAGNLTTVSIKNKPGLIESWPDFTNLDNDLSQVYLINYDGNCNDVNNWMPLPYVSYDSIQLTGVPVFYTLISKPASLFDHGYLYAEVYAKLNSGINLNQKVSFGFIERSPWDY